MKYIDNSLSLNAINIPETHDTETFDICVLENEEISKILMHIRLIVNKLSIEISDYRRTQELDITEQL